VVLTRERLSRPGIGQAHVVDATCGIRGGQRASQGRHEGGEP